METTSDDFDPVLKAIMAGVYTESDTATPSVADYLNDWDNERIYSASLPEDLWSSDTVPSGNTGGHYNLNSDRFPQYPEHPVPEYLDPFIESGMGYTYRLPYGPWGILFEVIAIYAAICIASGRAPFYPSKKTTSPRWNVFLATTSFMAMFSLGTFSIWDLSDASRHALAWTTYPIFAASGLMGLHLVRSVAPLIAARLGLFGLAANASTEKLDEKQAAGMHDIEAGQLPDRPSPKKACSGILRKIGLVIVGLFTAVSVGCLVYSSWNVWVPGMTMTIALIITAIRGTLGLATQRSQRSGQQSGDVSWGNRFRRVLSGVVPALIRYCVVLAVVALLYCHISVSQLIGPDNFGYSWVESKDMWTSEQSGHPQSASWDFGRFWGYAFAMLLPVLSA